MSGIYAEGAPGEPGAPPPSEPGSAPPDMMVVPEYEDAPKVPGAGGSAFDVEGVAVKPRLMIAGQPITVVA